MYSLEAYVATCCDLAKNADTLKSWPKLATPSAGLEELFLSIIFDLGIPAPQKSHSADCLIFNGYKWWDMAFIGLIGCIGSSNRRVPHNMMIPKAIMSLAIMASAAKDIQTSSGKRRLDDIFVLADWLSGGLSNKDVHDKFEDLPEAKLFAPNNPCLTNVVGLPGVQLLVLRTEMARCDRKTQTMTWDALVRCMGKLSPDANPSKPKKIKYHDITSKAKPLNRMFLFLARGKPSLILLPYPPVQTTLRSSSAMRILAS